MVKVGDVVRDRFSGVEGVAIARTEWLYGCVRITIQPRGEKDGRPVDMFVINEPQCDVLAPSNISEESRESAGTHGDRPTPQRSQDPQRAQDPR